jgi:hypothetical protein
MSIPIIGPVLELVAKLIKKKQPFVLWYWGIDKKWAKKSQPISARQCKKARNELVRLGMEPRRFTILHEGTEPPLGGPAWDK